MRAHQVMFMGFILATGTLVSLTFAGGWIGATETALADSFTIFKQANILGIWSVPVPNVNFFLVGARAAGTFDFAFFQGPAGIFQWLFLLVIGWGFMWGLFTIAIGAIQGLFRRVTG